MDPQFINESEGTIINQQAVGKIWQKDMHAHSEYSFYLTRSDQSKTPEALTLTAKLPYEHT